MPLHYILCKMFPENHCYAEFFKERDLGHLQSIFSGHLDSAILVAVELLEVAFCESMVNQHEVPK